MGEALPPLWSPSLPSVVTGLGPEPLLHCRALTPGLEWSWAVSQCPGGWRGSSQHPAPARSETADPMDASAWGGLKMNPWQERALLWRLRLRQGSGHQGEVLGPFPFRARRWEKGWGEAAHRAGRAFGCAVHMDKPSLRVVSFLSLPPIPSPQLKNIKHMKYISQGFSFLSLTPPPLSKLGTSRRKRPMN